MREIKFRAWTGDRMFEPYYFERAYDGYEMPYKCYEDWRDLEDGRSQFCEIMQYTGLKDKNGKEIYEGDILRLSDGDVSHHRIYWDNKSGRWMDERLEDGDSLTCYDCFEFVTDCKVIGNIYENPELLKQ